MFSSNIPQNAVGNSVDPISSLFGSNFRVNPHFEIFCDAAPNALINLSSNTTDTNQGWLKSTRNRFTAINLGDGGINAINLAQPWWPQFSGGYYCGLGNVISIVPAVGTDTDIFLDSGAYPDGERFRHMFDRNAINPGTSGTLFTGAVINSYANWFTIGNQTSMTGGRYYLFVPNGWVVESSQAVLNTIRVHSTGYHAFYKSLTFGDSTPSYAEPTYYAMCTWVDGSLYKGSFAFTASGLNNYLSHLPFIVDVQNNRLVFSPIPGYTSDSVSKEIIFSGIFSACDNFNYWTTQGSSQFNGFKYSPLDWSLYLSVPLLTNAA